MKTRKWWQRALVLWFGESDSRVMEAWKWWQWILALWFGLSFCMVIGLADGPAWSVVVLVANLVASGLAFCRLVPLGDRED